MWYSVMVRPYHPTLQPCVELLDPQLVQQIPLMSVELSDCMEIEMDFWVSSWTGGIGLVKLTLDLVENNCTQTVYLQLFTDLGSCDDAINEMILLNKPITNNTKL